MLENYPDILNLKSLCEVLNIGRNAGLKLLQSKQIKSFRIGLTYKIPKQSIIDYIESKMV